ncbi:MULTISPECIES: hypothetical protein [Cyanophyceae]|uniref:hypothetical protein n=1 Tax=Cyanophyceae TaxID=3028117 RepID=UPI0016832CC7|nr:hypothetical protein [Trichocoleus sp. FACHB-40]MBD2006320.1 hypothetical protein [Trichocoleus sp. FACHB-40]
MANNSLSVSSSNNLLSLEELEGIVMSDSIDAVDLPKLKTLSKADEKALESCELALSRGFKVDFIKGLALQCINENRHYLKYAETFEQYCEKRWELSVRTAYELIDAAKVIAIFLRNSAEVLPKNKSQCLPLATLLKNTEPEEQEQKVLGAWSECLKDRGKPTMSQIEEVVNRIVGKPRRDTAGSLPTASQQPVEDEIFYYQGKEVPGKIKAGMTEDAYGFLKPGTEVYISTTSQPSDPNKVYVRILGQPESVIEVRRNDLKTLAESFDFAVGDYVAQKQNYDFAIERLENPNLIQVYGRVTDIIKSSPNPFVVKWNVGSSEAGYPGEHLKKIPTELIEEYLKQITPPNPSNPKPKSGGGGGGGGSAAKYCKGDLYKIIGAYPEKIGQVVEFIEQNKDGSMRFKFQNREEYIALRDGDVEYVGKAARPEPETPLERAIASTLESPETDYLAPKSLSQLEDFLSVSKSVAVYASENSISQTSGTREFHQILSNLQSSYQSGAIESAIITMSVAMTDSKGFLKLVKMAGGICYLEGDGRPPMEVAIYLGKKFQAFRFYLELHSVGNVALEPPSVSADNGEDYEEPEKPEVAEVREMSAGEII